MPRIVEETVSAELTFAFSFSPQPDIKWCRKERTWEAEIVSLEDTRLVLESG